MEGEAMGRIPNWLRWILFLPAAIIACIIAYNFLRIIIGFVPDEFFFFPKKVRELFSQIILYGIEFAASWFSGFVFVFAGTIVAPKRKRVVSASLVVAMGIVIGMGIAAKILVENFTNLGWLELIVGSIGFMAGAINACFEMPEEDTGTL